MRLVMPMTVRHVFSNLSIFLGGVWCWSITFSTFLSAKRFEVRRYELLCSNRNYQPWSPNDRTKSVELLQTFLSTPQKVHTDEARAAICKSNSILMPIDGLLNNRTLNIGVHYIHYFCGHGSTLGTAMRFASVVPHVSQTNYLSFHKHPVYMAKYLESWYVLAFKDHRCRLGAKHGSADMFALLYSISALVTIRQMKGFLLVFQFKACYALGYKFIWIGKLHSCNWLFG